MRSDNAASWEGLVSGWRFPALCAALLGGTFLIYRAGLGGGWLYDDFPNIVNNSALRFAHLSWNNLWQAAFSLKTGPTWRPLSMASFALEVHAFGLDPYAFKLTNLLIHLANGALVLALLLQVLGAMRETGRLAIDRLRGRALALTVAALWLLAPIAMSTVLYAVQREVLLASFFTLVGLIGYVNLRTALWRRETAGRFAALVLATLAAGFLATISKETGVLLPLYALVLEAGIFRFRTAAGSTSRPTWLYFGLFLFLPAAAGIAWLLTHGLLAGYGARPFTLAERLLTEPRVMFHYLGWIIAPRLHALGFFHDDISLSTGALSPATTIPAIVGCIALIGGGLWLLPRRPLIGMGLLWFFAGQALESTFVPLILVFEHRNYLASLGPLLALTAFLLAEPSLKRLRVAAAAALFGLIVLSAWVGAGRSWEWSSNARLAVYQAAHHPRSANAAYMLARELTNATLSGATQLAPQARRALERAASLPGNGLVPYTGMIILAAGRGQPVPDAWFRKMLASAREHALRPTDIYGLAAVNRCLESGTCAGLRPRLLNFYRSLYRAAKPGTPPSALANLLVLEANATGYATRADRRRARQLLDQAARLSPEQAAYRENLVILALRDNDLAAAQQALRQLEDLNHHGTLDATIAELKKAIDAAWTRQHSPVPATH